MSDDAAQAERIMRFIYALRSKGVTDPAVLRAMERIDRGAFVRGIFAERAYEDMPLPIACGQTISQPSVVALMTEALEVSPRDKVLEVGTGSGYQAAILSQLARRVYTVERHRRLVLEARSVFEALALVNITALSADGSFGLPEQAPFDRIIVTAAAEDPPGPLLAQLRVGISEDFGGVAVDPVIRAAFRDRVARITPHVASVTHADLSLGDMDRVFDILRAESFVAAFGDAVSRRPEDFAEQIRVNVALGLEMSLRERAWAHGEQTRILRRFNALMKDVDIILLPTAPVSPFPWTEPFADIIDGSPQDIYYRWLALTYRGSLMGGPSLTLPSGRDAKGMPFGLQVLGPVRGDNALLAAARSLEALLQQDTRTARPEPDFASLKPAAVDPRSVIEDRAPTTQPTATQPAAANTAV